MKKVSDAPSCGEYVALNTYCAYDIRKTVSDYFEEALPKAGFTISMYYANVKLLLMFTACLSALYAHYGCKFPRDSYWIAGFALLYFVQAGLIFLLDFFKFKKSCAIFDDKATGKRVFLDIQEPTKDSNLTLTLRSDDISVSVSKSVGEFFSSDGILNNKVLFVEFMALYDQFKSNCKSNKKVD